MIQLTPQDEIQLKKKGIAKDKVIQQVNTFKEGIPFVELKNAAVIGNGILRFSDEEESDLIKLYNEKSKNLDILKFVPASGAASRMFKALFSFLEVYNPEKESLEDYLKRTNDKDIKILSSGLERLPFYKKVMDSLPSGIDSEGKKVYLFVEKLLSEEGFNYGFYPKGLLPFHDYGHTAATPFEEHLKEGALYAASNGKSSLHFTISEQHEDYVQIGI